MTADGERCKPEFDIDFPEKFQKHLVNMFPGSYGFLNTRAATSFYADLLDFSPQRLVGKRPLLQLLQEYVPDLLTEREASLCCPRCLPFSAIGGRSK